MWTCPKCGERLEDQCDSCWKCAGQTAVPATVPKGRRGWGVAFGLGVVIELGIVALLACLPRESWLFGRVLGFLEYSHFPFLWFLNVAGPESVAGGIIAVLLVGTLMALVWACLLVWGSRLVAAGLARLGLTSRQKRWLGWSAGALGAASLMFAVMDASGGKPAPFAPTPAAKAVVSGNTTLALDLYQQLRTKPGNVFFSPYGVSTGLGLVYAGARGGTERELARAAHFNTAPADLHAAFGELNQRMTRLQRGRLTLITANSLWRQSGKAFLNAFMDAARRDYAASVEPVDFEHDCQAASRRVNAWIERQTRGRVQAMVVPGQLDANTRLVLCNAIYFKGNWQSQFKMKETSPAPFYVSSNETVSVPMMKQEAELRMAWSEEPRAALLELPYYGGDLAMVIVLPEEKDGLAEVEAALTAENLGSWLARLDAANPHRTWVHLPRFTMRQSMDLVPALRALGAGSAFTDQADFSGMDGTKSLFLSAALQRTFVEVNEQGTEAAATTLFEAKTKGMPERFIADHPFLLLIRDRASGTVLFLGRLVVPGAE